MTTRDELLRDFFEYLKNRSDVELLDRVETVGELVRADAFEGWEVVLGLINLAASDEELDFVAAGPLENLLVYHGAEIAASIHDEALRNPRVRDALAGVILDPRPAQVQFQLGEWLHELI